MKTKSLIFPVIVVVISFIALYFISQFPTPSFQDASVTSKFFPTAVAIIQIIICFFIILGELLNRKETTYKAAFFNKYSVFGVVFIISYVALIYVFGYFFSTLAAFIVYLFFFKIKTISYYITAVIFTCAVYYIFANVFFVSLPEGLIFGGVL
jgi:hypothetical protein